MCDPKADPPDALKEGIQQGYEAVSYTHLDVYKRQTQDSPRIAKTLLSKEWFRLTDGQLQLYKQLYHIVFEINNCLLYTSRCV